MGGAGAGEAAWKPRPPTPDFLLSSGSDRSTAGTTLFWRSIERSRAGQSSG